MYSSDSKYTSPHDVAVLDSLPDALWDYPSNDIEAVDSAKHSELIILLVECLGKPFPVITSTCTDNLYKYCQFIFRRGEPLVSMLPIRASRSD